MWALVALGCIFSDPGTVWVGNQSAYAHDMPNAYCKQVAECPNVPADFDERQCKAQLEAFVNDMPCYSSSAANECMTVWLNPTSEQYMSCENYWSFPNNAICLRASWESASCEMADE